MVVHCNTVPTTHWYFYFIFFHPYTFFTLKYNLICPSLFCQFLFDISGTCICLACIWNTNNVIRKDMEDNWGELLCEGLDSVFLVIVIAACYCFFGKAFFKLFRRSLTLFTINWKKRNNRYSKSLTEIHDFLLFGWHMNTAGWIPDSFVAEKFH